MSKQQENLNNRILAEKVKVLVEYLRHNRYNQKQWGDSIKVASTAISRSQNSLTLRPKEAEQIISRSCEKLNCDLEPDAHNGFRVKLRDPKLSDLHNDEITPSNGNWLHFFAGLYVAYMIQVREKRIAAFFFLRLPNGNLAIRTDSENNRAINRTMSGKWSLINKNRTILDEIELQEDDEKYRVHQYIEAVFTDDNTMVGTYSGFSSRDLKPIGGAVLMRKINDWIGDETAMTALLKTKTSLERSLTNQESMARLIKTEPELINFFMGNNDYNLRIENVQLFRNTGFLPLAPANTESVAGAYMSYRIGADKTFVYGNPLMICRDGRVQMKRTATVGQYGEYRGFASLENGFLSINIDRKIDTVTQKQTPINLFCIYNWGNFSRNEFQYAFGTATLLTMFNMPRSGEEVLVPVNIDDPKNMAIRTFQINNLPDDTTPLERNIIAYLQKKDIIVIDNMPNSPL